ncbi:SgcJ/EcaC family oxidoreductase [Labrys neptuniae]|uniref:YybH family protein n=1 Tax=Labrys neptuniae TaxID=376174 RepID=UPI00288FF381|nr:SgcJ/EcaC family oxidoreductase [Labrys neptuniae]MDT3377427.1 SgcJ/EcaC family oxidoreductase [Labrys neptuniae]
MSDDEKAIRSVVEGWMQASRRGDLAAILDLMTDDVVFMVPGREPFGKEAFVAAFKGLDGVKMEGSSEIAELKLLGDWAFIRNHIDITATPPGGSAIRRSGYTLTLLRREADGRWRLARDANLLATLSG